MKRSQYVDAVRDWLGTLPKLRDGLPARGSVAAGLVILERLKENVDFDIRGHLAGGRAQITGLTNASVAKILSRFGENRPFLKEGGRTNRGTPAACELLLSQLQQAGLGDLSPSQRRSALDDCQEWLVSKVGEYFSRKPIKVVFDPQLTSTANVKRVINAARAVRKLASVAQYLVGAKLQLRFEKLTISNELASSADASSGRAGDFEIGDSAIHVTITPSNQLIEKCQSNLDEGRRAILIVPEDAIFPAKEYAKSANGDRIMILSLECFIAANIEELGEFRQAGFVSGFRRLLELYNDRVNAIETDKSLLIEIPKNLR